MNTKDREKDWELWICRVRNRGKEEGNELGFQWRGWQVDGQAETLGAAGFGMYNG